MSNEGRMKSEKKISKTKLAKIGLGLSVLLVFAIIVGITFKGRTSKADKEDYLVNFLFSLSLHMLRKHHFVCLFLYLSLPGLLRHR